MMINDEIEYLHRVIVGAMEDYPVRVGVFERLFSWSIVGLFNEINSDLEELNQQLDTELNLEAISIKYDLFLDREYWTKNWLFVDFKSLYEKDGEVMPIHNYTTKINRMTDYLPNGVKGYSVNPAVLLTFKNSIHQLCDEDRITFSDLFYSLNSGLDRMLELLGEIKNKVRNPKNHLYIKLWNETLEIYDNDEFDKDYKEWLEDNGEPTFEELKARQKQEIFKFLNRNFLRYCNTPTGAEIKKRKLVINEDDLPYGTVIPDNMAIECTKFERFIEWKDEHILSLDYEKIGQYIYKNYQQFDEGELYNITDFDRIMDVIHEAMAKLKPNLAKSLKRYEEDQVNEMIKDCKKIINTCKPFLKEDLKDTFLDCYIDRLMFDNEIKAEARNKLGGQSKNKYICHMIAHLYNFFVFDVKYNADDFSEALHKEISAVGQNTIKRYINDCINSREGALYSWTKKNIDSMIVQQTVK